MRRGFTAYLVIISARGFGFEIRTWDLEQELLLTVHLQYVNYVYESALLARLSEVTCTPIPITFGSLSNGVKYTNIPPLGVFSALEEDGPLPLHLIGETSSIGCLTHRPSGFGCPLARQCRTSPMARRVLINFKCVLLDMANWVIVLRP